MTGPEDQTIFKVLIQFLLEKKPPFLFLSFSALYTINLSLIVYVFENSMQIYVIILTNGIIYINFILII